MDRNMTNWISRIAFVIAFLMWAWAFSAPAQTTAAHSLTPTLALARTAVREAGVRAYERDDAAAIAAVVSFRAENIYHTTFVRALMRYTRDAPIRRDRPRPWITQLMPSARRPSMFPQHIPWAGHALRHWRRTYGQARDVMAGEIEHRCVIPDVMDDEPAVPHDWGSDADAARYQRDNPSAIELDCGQTCRPRDGRRCQHYFHLPRYGARFGP